MSANVFVGIDAGSRAIKVAVLDNNRTLLGTRVASQGVRQSEIAESTYRELMVDLNISNTIPRKIVATGYARHLLTFADARVTEITCHAKGVHSLFPDARTIIEMGGQDSKSIRLDNAGKVKDFMMNDRCAAGTGRFLEVVSERLHIPLNEFKNYVYQEEYTQSPITMSSMCVVFAETEIIGLLASDIPPGKILIGVQNAVCSRVVSMLGQQNAIPRVVFTGGVAQIDGMKNAVERALGHKVDIPEYPQFTGAIGAALIARSRND